VSRRPGGPSLPDLTGVRVLVVDDDPNVRDAVTFVLQHFGATVTPAGSVQEALRALRAVRHHVLLSDLAMPDEDGFALIRQVRAQEPGEGGCIPAASFSARSGPEDEARARESGFDIHLGKPVEPIRLAEVVGLLARRSPYGRANGDGDHFRAAS
jgi:CheY-like chemotaxis protein